MEKRSTSVIWYLIGIIFIIIAALLNYFQGYKDNYTIQLAYFALLFIGCIIVFFVTMFIINPDFLSEKKVSFKKQKRKWLKQKAYNIVAYLGLGILFVFSSVYISNLSDKRVSRILEHQPTKVTVGFVTEIQIRNSRGGGKRYAIFSYMADNENIEQAIFDGDSKFFVGERLQIKYSVEYPAMFEIIEIPN